jgi:putative resolvase
MINRHARPSSIFGYRVRRRNPIWRINAVRLSRSARGLTVDEWVAEIGGGLNFTRPKFLKLVDAIIAGEIATLVIAHKDRLARFGYELLMHLCDTHHCTLLVLNQETLSPEQEMIQDLLAIVHCFSSRLYGLRNYRKALKDALAHDPSAHDPPQPNP